ncbi:MAG: MFS transporter [Actinomycetota bacterium]
MPPTGVEKYAVANLVATTGTGITLSVGVLYFITIVELPTATVATALTTGALIGLAAMPAVGRVAGVFGAKPVYLGLLGLQALALTTWQMVTGPASAFAALAVSLLAERGINAVIGGFVAELPISPTGRARSRAYLRSVTNVGLALGGALGGAGLAWGSPVALHAAVALAAGMPLGAALIVVRVPVRGARTQGTARPAARVLRDRRYVVLAATNGVMAIHLDVLSVGLPLWLTLHDHIPRWVAGAAVGLNAALVALLQVSTTHRVQRGVTRVAARFAGAALAGALLLLAVIGEATPIGWILTLLLVWIVLLTVAELIQSAVEFIVSYDAAPSWAHPEYQAAYALGRGTIRALAPVMFALVVPLGLVGWVALAAASLAAALLHSRFVPEPVTEPGITEVAAS